MSYPSNPSGQKEKYIRPGRSKRIIPTGWKILSLSLWESCQVNRPGAGGSCRDKIKSVAADPSGNHRPKIYNRLGGFDGKAFFPTGKGIENLTLALG